MTSLAINLARECGALVGVKHATDCDGEMIIFAPEELTRFYTLAQAQALSANGRVEGRDAASSRRVPSHDGLEGGD